MDDTENSAMADGIITFLVIVWIIGSYVLGYICFTYKPMPRVDDTDKWCNGLAFALSPAWAPFWGIGHVLAVKAEAPRPEGGN